MSLCGRASYTRIMHDPCEEYVKYLRKSGRAVDIELAGDVELLEKRLRASWMIGLAILGDDVKTDDIFRIYDLLAGLGA